MSFLKTLGKILATGGRIAAQAMGIFPVIQPFLGSGKAAEYAPVVLNDLSQIASVVTTAETMFASVAGQTGPQKLAAATPLVVSILKTSQAFDGKKIADEALAEQGAQKIISGVVDFMNAIHPDEVKPIVQ